MNVKEETKGVMQVLLAALLFGSVGIFVRLISKEIPPYSQVLMRILLATFIVLLMFVPGSKKFFAMKNKNDLLFYFIGGALGYGLTATLFTLAVLKTTVANAVFLLFTEPIFAVLLASIFLGEKITKNVLASVAVSFAGAFLILNPSSLAELTAGNLYALAAGFFYAVYVIVGRKMGETYAPEQSTFWTFIFAAVFVAPIVGVFEPQITNLKISGVTWLLLLGFAAVVLSAYFMLNSGLKKITAGHGSIILLFEPVSSSLYAFLFFSEIPSIGTTLGALLITAGIVYLALSKKKTQ